MTVADPAWRESIETAQRESGGALTLDVARPGDFPEVFRAVLCGDASALRLCRAVSDTVHRIATAPRRKQMRCASCPRTLRQIGYSIVLATPARDDPTRAVALAVCAKCGVTRAEIVAKAVTGLQRIWPQSRLVDGISNHGAGRA